MPVRESRESEEVVYYNKLVSDKIPEIIRSTGNECEIETADPQIYIEKLQEKLTEELNEYLKTGDLKELADLEEVIRALVKASGLPYREFENLRKDKLQRRGGFEKRLILKKVYKA